MGSPLIPIVANIFMEDFETKALETTPCTPSLWKRFVDDTFVVIQAAYKEEFFQHINSIDENFQFTAEHTRAGGAMPFLDTLVIPQNDGSLLTLCTESLLTPTNTCNGIATMPYVPSTVLPAHHFTGPKMFVLQNNN